MRGSYGCLDGRFRGSHAHGGRLVILGTTDDSVSTKLAVNPKRAHQFENDDHEGCRNNQKDVWHGPLPPFGLEAVRCRCASWTEFRSTRVPGTPPRCSVCTSFGAQGAV